ncbi:hypothetical protein FRUB_09781 [Fimbriiglobus ruber]|uniref:Uncharacterized protein n=2 Tax=Fimbriiglobus ruber TaxID=1908690 RepID=A0A225DCT1_9BACT|nr:hypothetical protein FRUB_09781 [Fimbriiglobus ruber]
MLQLGELPTSKHRDSSKLILTVEFRRLDGPVLEFVPDKYMERAGRFVLQIEEAQNLPDVPADFMKKEQELKELFPVHLQDIHIALTACYRRAHILLDTPGYREASREAYLLLDAKREQTINEVFAKTKKRKAGKTKKGGK